MTITEQLVLDLLQLLKGGIVNGAGHGTEFCVQQAVNRAAEGLGKASLEVPDAHHCLGEYVKDLGITLNDCGVWHDDLDRAKCLTPFAVAELGSNEISMHEFRRKLDEALGYDFTDAGISDRDQALKIIKESVRIMKEMGTQGSKFLHILEEPDKKKAKKEANKLGDQIYAAQMAEWKGEKPKQQQQGT